MRAMGPLQAVSHVQMWVHPHPAALLSHTPRPGDPLHLGGCFPTPWHMVLPYPLAKSMCTGRHFPTLLHCMTEAGTPAPMWCRALKSPLSIQKLPHGIELLDSLTGALSS